MRWSTFSPPESAQSLVGIVDGDDIVPVPGVSTLLALLIRGGGEMDERARAALADPAARYPLSAVKLLAPVPTPPSIRDFMAFEHHVSAGARRRGEEVPKEWYELPVFYFSNPHAVVGPLDPVTMPAGCSKFDFELEVAVIIGRAGSDVPVSEARDYIAGFTIMNDWSARDWQLTEGKVRGPGPSKSKDGATTLGPFLVTTDELADCWSGPHPDLEMSVSVNGREYGRDRLTNMFWTFEQLVSHASRGTWVKPGDVIASGTCAYGCLIELTGTHPEEYSWLAAGDLVTIDVSRLGQISNRIVAGVPGPSLS